MLSLFDNAELRQCLTSGYLSDYQIEFVWSSNDESKYSEFILEALQSGDFRIVFWLMSKVYPEVDPFVVFDAVQSAEHGIMSAVKWLFPTESETSVSDMMLAAMKRKRYDVCEWLLLNGVEMGSRERYFVNKKNDTMLMSMIEWENGVILADAAYFGLYNCLQYAHSNGFAWNEMVCSAAAIGGHYICLKYLHEHSCPWNRLLIPSAFEEIERCISTSDFDTADDIDQCIRYARMHGCPEEEN
jgi:hypothetical protein